MAKKKLGAAEVEVSIRDRVAKGLKGVENRLKGFGTRVSGIGAGLAGVGAAAGGIFAGLGAAVLYPTKLAAGLEQTTVAFTTMLGSADKANKLLGQLRDFAASTPLSFPDIAEAARNLAAFGVAAEDIPNELRRVGDVASAVGAPIGEIAELYGKAKVQGRLFGEDINQLTGRGIPIIGELAKQFGVAESAVKDLVKDGKVSFDNLQTAFVALTSEGGKFAGMMEAQSKTLAGRWSTLKDNLMSALIPIGQAASEVFGPMIESAIAVIKPVSELIKQNAGLAKVLVGVSIAGIAAAGALVAIGGTFVALGSVVSAAGALFTIFSGISIPILAAVAGVSALVVALGYFAYQTGIIQAALKSLLPALASMSRAVKATFGGLMDALSAGRYMLAARILWQGLKVVFLQGSDAVLTVMNQLLNNIWGMTRKLATNLVTTLYNLFKSVPDLIRSAMMGKANIAIALGQLFSGEVSLDELLDKPIAQAERKLNNMRRFAARQKQAQQVTADSITPQPAIAQRQARQAAQQQAKVVQQMRAEVAKAQRAAKVRKPEALDKVPELAANAGTRVARIESRGTSSAAAIANGFFGSGRNNDQQETAQNTRRMTGQLQKLLLRKQLGFG